MPSAGRRLTGPWVRAEYLPTGYGNASSLFALPDQAGAAAQRLLDWALPWFGEDPVLGMYGTDHTAPAPDLVALVGRLNRAHEAPLVRLSTLAQYIASAPALEPDAPRWRGEMRSGARANVLMGVASARIDIKQAAARAETLLERYAEPLSALHIAPDAWPSAFLRLAWGKVIENSAHDSICGCSIDPVVDQVLVRFAEAEQIANTLARRAAVAVARDVPRGAIAILNPTPALRVGLVEAELPVPVEWDSVAFELADGTSLPTQEVGRKDLVLFEEELRGEQVDELFRRFHGREIFDHAWNGYRIDGRAITLMVDVDADPARLDVDSLRAEVTAAMRAAPEEIWHARVVARPRRTLVASVPAPALGWTAVRAIEGAPDAPGAVRVDATSMSNGLITVLVATDGSLRLETADGVVADGVGRVVDGGDVGDSYNYGPPPRDRFVDAPDETSVTVEQRGPVLGRLRVVRTYAWPAGASPDRLGRSEGISATEVTTGVELRTGEPFLRLTVAFDNRSVDHRVRFHAHVPRPDDRSSGEGQFAVVERGMVGEGGYREEPLATFPAHGWVDAGGLAVLLDHLSEYELVDQGRELAITVLRSTGFISRYDNPFRQDPAGPEIAIPNAQMRGSWRMTFGLYPHAGGWADGGVVEVAERYRHNLLSAAGAAPPDATWPPQGAGEVMLSVEGNQVELASLRRRDGWLEARVVNLSPGPRDVVLRGGLIEAREATLRGEPGEALAVMDGALQLVLGPAEIRTVQLRRHQVTTARGDVLDASGPRQSA